MLAENNDCCRLTLCVEDSSDLVGGEDSQVAAQHAGGQELRVDDHVRGGDAQQVGGRVSADLIGAQVDVAGSAPAERAFARY